MLGRKSPPTKEPFIPRDSRPDLYHDGAGQATDGRGAGSVPGKGPDGDPKQPDKQPDEEPGKGPDKQPDKQPDEEPGKGPDKQPDKQPDKKDNDGPPPGKRDGEPRMIGLIEELMRPGSSSSRS